jgi:hypothetical protein
MPQTIPNLPFFLCQKGRLHSAHRVLSTGPSFGPVAKLMQQRPHVILSPSPILFTDFILQHFPVSCPQLPQPLAAHTVRRIAVGELG